MSLAIKVLAMVGTLPAALSQQMTDLFGAGAHRTFDVHQRCVEAQGFNGA